MKRSKAILTSFVAVLMAAGLLSGCSSGGGGYEVTAIFPKTVALFPSSLVRVLGLPAGKVTSIEVTGTVVEVKMRIPDDVPIPADALATIVPLSLIGERYVQLSPAWKEGVPRGADGMIIPLERTSVPVEPDEALAALKHFLDALDPDATGRLVKNLAADLAGNGAALNDALAGLGTITETFAAKDEQLVNIIDHFDRFTATLAGRDQQLGRVLDAFAATTGALADERASIESLLAALAALAKDGLDLVSEHRVRLDRDLTILHRTLGMVKANIVQIEQLLDSGPLLVSGPNLDGRRGLLGAYDEKYHHIDLRNSMSPTVAQALSGLGLPGNVVCLPIDVACSPTPASGPTTSAEAARPAGAPKLPTLTASPMELPPAAKKRSQSSRPQPRQSSEPFGGIARMVAGVFG